VDTGGGGAVTLGVIPLLAVGLVRVLEVVILDSLSSLWELADEDTSTANGFTAEDMVEGSEEMSTSGFFFGRAPEALILAAFCLTDNGAGEASRGDGGTAGLTGV